MNNSDGILIKEAKSQRAIGRQINVHPSTASGELSRNGNRFGPLSVDSRRRERRPGNKGVKPETLEEAQSLLRREDWSPRQRAGYLSLKGIHHISLENIYARIRSDESGEPCVHCRHGMKYRRHVKARRKTKVRNIPGRVSVHERPPEADGHRFGGLGDGPDIGQGPEERHPHPPLEERELYDDGALPTGEGFRRRG